MHALHQSPHEQQACIFHRIWFEPRIGFSRTQYCPHRTAPHSTIEASISTEAALRIVAASTREELDAAMQSQPEVADRVRAALPTAASTAQPAQQAPPAPQFVAMPPPPFMPMFGGPQFGSLPGMAPPMMVLVGPMQSPPSMAMPSSGASTAMPAAVVANSQPPQPAPQANTNNAGPQRDDDFAVPVRGRDIARPRRGRAQSQHHNPATHSDDRTAQRVVWHQDRAGNEWADPVDAQHGHNDDWHSTWWQNWNWGWRDNSWSHQGHSDAWQAAPQDTPPQPSNPHGNVRNEGWETSLLGQEDSPPTARQTILREPSRSHTLRDCLHGIALPLQSWSLQQKAR